LDKSFLSGIVYTVVVSLLSLRANSFSLKDTMIIDFIRVCYQSKESRKIGLFFLINFCFMFIELSYGILANSLGLITDSFHMLFDCMGLFLGLCASYIAQLPSNKHFTFGYGKVETLSGFFNGLLLVFTAFNIF